MLNKLFSFFFFNKKKYGFYLNLSIRGKITLFNNLTAVLGSQSLSKHVVMIRLTKYCLFTDSITHNILCTHDLFADKHIKSSSMSREGVVFLKESLGGVKNFNNSLPI